MYKQHLKKIFYLTVIVQNHTTVPKPVTMKKTAMVFGFLVITISAESQARVIDSIIDEGQRLYRLEMASWQGTNIYFKKFKEQRENIGGLFSYEMNDQVKCVIFSKPETPRVMATISFDTSFNVSTAKTDTIHREFTNYEQIVYTLRNKAFDEIDKDTMFQLFENTSFNVIPVVDSFYRKVYITSSPEVKGVILFGNDYLLHFNDDDSLISKKALHHKLIPVEFGKDTDPELIETFHNHSPEAGKFISPTDICALRLYGKFAKWKQHLIISASHVCIWNMEDNNVEILTKDQWNKRNSNKKQVSLSY